MSLFGLGTKKMKNKEFSALFSNCISRRKSGEMIETHNHNVEYVIEFINVRVWDANREDRDNPLVNNRFKKPTVKIQAYRRDGLSLIVKHDNSVMHIHIDELRTVVDHNDSHYMVDSGGNQVNIDFDNRYY